MSRDESTFAELRADWVAVTLRSRTAVHEWELRLESLASDEASLRDGGRWVHGRSDYLGVVGRHRDELAHSRMLAWLLDPCARHGLGARVLAGVLREAHPELPLPARLERANVFTEVVLGEGRLDVVVESPGLYLVIENKVDADEAPGQCAYYCEHVQHAHARYVLLSPDGRNSLDPTDFKPLRFAQVAGVLARALSDAPVPPEESAAASGRRVASDYLQTLRIEFDEHR